MARSQRHQVNPTKAGHHQGAHSPLAHGGKKKTASVSLVILTRKEKKSWSVWQVSNVNVYFLDFLDAALPPHKQPHAVLVHEENGQWRMRMAKSGIGGGGQLFPDLNINFKKK